MFKWLTSLIGPSNTEQTMNALPIEINAHEGVAIARAVGRLMNLYSVPYPGDEVLHTIERYKLTIAGYGFKPPANFEEAEQLSVEIRK